MELIDIAVRDKQAHPRLAGRTTGHVRAVLTERRGRADRTVMNSQLLFGRTRLPGASDADIDMALMLKAAAIIARMKANLAG